LYHQTAPGIVTQVKQMALCVFRPMPITDSGACRSPIPADADHRFQRMPITRSG
jgi:hypothetical protein